MEAGTKSNKYKGSPWSEVEIAELEELYDRFKDQTDFSTLSNNPANLTTTVEIADPKEDDICEGNSSLPKDVEEMFNITTKKSKSKKRLDIIDAILDKLSTADKRNRRQVIRQLKLMVG